MQQQNYESAVQLLLEALHYEPDNKSILEDKQTAEKRARAAELKQAGLAAMKAGEYETAAEDFKVAMSLDASDAFYPTAIEQAERKQQAASCCHQGDHQMEVQDYEEAVKAYQRAVELDPSNEDYKAKCAHAKEMAAQKRSALDAAEAETARKAKANDLKRQGVSAMQQADFTTAVGLFQHSLEIDASDEECQQLAQQAARCRRGMSSSRTAKHEIEVGDCMGALLTIGTALTLLKLPEDEVVARVLRDLKIIAQQEAQAKADASDAARAAVLAQVESLRRQGETAMVINTPHEWAVAVHCFDEALQQAAELDEDAQKRSVLVELKELLHLARDGEAASAKVGDLLHTAEAQMAACKWKEAEISAKLAVDASNWHEDVETSVLVTMRNNNSAVEEAKAQARAAAHAGELGRRLKAAGAMVGELTCSLMWDNEDDLDLHCETPTGSHIFWNAKVGSCGGHLDVDMNASDKHLTCEGVENLYWPKPPAGHYKIWVENNQDRTDGPHGVYSTTDKGWAGGGKNFH